MSLAIRLRAAQPGLVEGAPVSAPAEALAAEGVAALPAVGQPVLRQVGVLALAPCYNRK